MTPYIFLFILNVIFALFADMTFNRNKKVCWFWLAMIILSDTILFGFRDFGVGTDTNVYIQDYFHNTIYIHNLHDFIVDEDSGDKGYLLLAMITRKFTSHPQGLLVATSLFQILFIVLGMYQFKKVLGIKFYIYILLYDLTLSAASLNNMRQFCAMGLLLLGFSLLLQGKWKHYIVFQVAAYFFHSTSVFFLIVPFVYYMSHMKNIKMRNLMTIAGIIMILVMMASFFYFLAMAGDLGIIKESYADRYGEYGRYVANESFSTGKTKVLLVLNNLVMIFFAWRYKALNSKIVYIIFTLFTLTTILEQLGFIVMYTFRLAFYVGIVYYVYLSLMYDSRKVPLPFKLLGYMLFAYIFIKSTIGGANEIYPYTSRILGIW